MQNIFLKIFRLETLTFDLPQPGIRKNEKIWVFWGLKKKNFTDAVEYLFLHMVDTPKSSIAKIIF